MAQGRINMLAKHLGPGHPELRSTSSVSSAAQAVLNTRRNVAVLGSHMSYLDTGKGDNVVLFLHGNPTSAYLWRNIIPHVSPIARCVAPDLIGMGHSGKPDIMYKYAEHYRYLSAWIEKMGFTEKITLVIHDWGSGLGFHWANQHRDRVRAIVYMEALVSVVPSWEGWPDQARMIFQGLRSEAGEDMVLKNNFFVERLLPGSIIRPLEDDEMAEYLAPYKDSERSRLPTLTWPREIPIENEPKDVWDIAVAYNKWLSEDATIPKLYIDGDPGFFSKGIRIMTSSWPNQKTVQVKGLHFLQEDSPQDIGEAINSFLQDLLKK